MESKRLRKKITMGFKEYYEKWDNIANFREKITERTSGRVILAADKTLSFHGGGQIVAISKCKKSPTEDIARMLYWWNSQGGAA